MKFGLNDLKLRSKGLIPIAILGALLVGVAVLAILRLHDVSSRYNFLVENADAAIVKLVRANRIAQEIGYDAHLIIDYDGDNAVSRRAQSAYAEIPARVEALISEAAQLLPERAKEITRFGERIHSIYERAKQPIAIGLATPGLDHGSSLKPHELDEMAKGVKLMGAADTELQTLTADFLAFNDGVLSDNRHATDELNALASRTIWMLVIISAAALASGVALSMFLSSRTISTPIARLSKQMDSIAGGKLDITIDGLEHGDEIGAMARALEQFKGAAIEKRQTDAKAQEERRRHQEEQRRAEEDAIRRERELVVTSLGAGLARLSAKDLTFRMSDQIPEAYRKLQEDFNSAIAQLETAMREVAQGSEAMGETANQIAGAADELSKRTEQQAAALEETTAALSEITNTVSQSAEGASHASAIVGATKSDAEKSGAIVRQAVEAVSRIEKSSQAISQIIGVIDEIAFQTNLLALNAGVEAARAGEAGKGFAVVASEVRALAQRSAEAAKEIKGLIATSSTEVNQGVDLIGQTVKALEKIATQVVEIDRLVATIAAGAKDQATSLSEINAAVTQMDANTQKNAAMVEETTAAVSEMRREADELVRTVGGFEVARAGGQFRSGRSGAGMALPKTVPMLKTMAGGQSGGAVRKAEAGAVEGSWEEF